MHNNNTETTIVSFFSGYGGLEKGISAALSRNTRVLAYVERDSFPVANLVAKMEQGLMDAAPIFTDVTKFPYREFRGLVDIACGGVPCQPHSNAGKREGGADERFLFNDFISGMSEMRPGIIFIENVQGLLSSKMPDGTLCIRYILNQLENIGYCVENNKGQPLLGIFSAAEVGAPHQRKRVFILAYDKSRGTIGLTQIREQKRQTPCGERFNHSGEDVAHRHHQGLQRRDGEVLRERAGQRAIGESSSQVWPSRPGKRQYLWEPPRVVGGVGLADSRLLRQTERQEQTAGLAQRSEAGMENSDEFGRRGGNKSGAEIKSPLGGNIDGPTPGLDLPRYAAVSNQELAEVGLTMDEAREIHEWLTRGTNRTDELRMCGNGVLPQTAEKAWRTLLAEIQEAI